MVGRVLVTGGSGFIGRRLLPLLVASGYSCVAPVRERQPQQAGVDFVLSPSIEAVDWRPLLAGVDAVAHLAGLAHADVGDAETLYDRINAEATLRLAAASVGQASRFVFVSSIRAISGPTGEIELGEQSPARPTDAYGRAKRRAEIGLAALDLPSTILRPVVVYGPGAKANMARLARLAAIPAPLPFGAMRAPRSFLSLDNMASAILFALARPGAQSETYVVADPEPSSVAKLLTGLRAGMDRAPRLMAIPPGWLGAAARLAGQGRSWSVLSGPLVARPRKLLDAGWRPPVPGTFEGARQWGEALRRAKR